MRELDERSGLYAARWDSDRERLTHPQHWGTGNGWVVAGIARALRPRPDWPAGRREELAGHARTVLDACLTHRRPDGLFHEVLDDPGSFVEAQAFHLLAYAALGRAG